ncbi:MAG: flagellar basal body rod protein FlgB [Plesiomonas sp.]|uniref:flagellar basal body rod protein FlgB n=1 Tax=Plesiomonas sp. TaxID=2486279 RepID=UPI003F3F2A12
MAISFDQALGVHQYTPGLRNQRTEILASNIANADTPGYKARDMDFSQALDQAVTQASSNLQRSSLSMTDERHISAASDFSGTTAYRIPNQPDAGDGNTVDLQVERNLFMENSIEYQASLQFLGGKFSGLKKAIRGD